IRGMSSLSAFLAERAGIGNATRKDMRLASALHDVGKIGVRDAVLLKPGPLSTEEQEVMQRHTVIGHRMLSDSASPLLQLGASIALTHHERWDGTGYPNGLAGEDIPPEGRVTALADVFDALTSDRVYRLALSRADALEQGVGHEHDVGTRGVADRGHDAAVAGRQDVGHPPGPGGGIVVAPLPQVGDRTLPELRLEVVALGEQHEGVPVAQPAGQSA